MKNFLKCVKFYLLAILSAPLLLLSGKVKKSVKALREQYESDPDSLPDDIRWEVEFSKLGEDAYSELKAGNYVEAKKLALRLLKMANVYTEHWNNGNAIHHAHTIIGLIDVRENKIDSALRHLKESSKISGSPQLNSFGPNFCLAMELLLKDKNDEVISYLENVGKFWEMGYKSLPKWISEIQQNEVPEQWARLEY